LKIGDKVVVMLRIWATLCKKQDGGNFFKNRVKILDTKKELQLGETLLETF
jgi:hypothetical protein